MSKNKIKEIISLQRKKKREDIGRFIIEGDKMAREAIHQKPLEVIKLYALEGWLKKQKTILEQNQIPYQLIDQRTLQQISSLKTPNQVLLLMEKPALKGIPLNLDQQLSLYLDGIQDPGNMGTILRIADWFGMKTVICSSSCVDVYSPKVIQATMGAILRVVTLKESLVNVLDQFPRLDIYGTLLDGESLFELKVSTKGIIVIGNEGSGISAENKDLITKPISIPKGPESLAESLNAAIATGIVCAYFSQKSIL